MASRSNSKTEEDVIWNSLPDKLYQHDFGDGRYFSIVSQDDSGFEVRLASKTLLKVLYLPSRNDIDGITLVKVVYGKETQRISLSKFDFQQLRAFLSFLETQDLDAIPERRISLATADGLTPQVRDQIRLLLLNDGGPELLQSLVDEGIITSADVLNTAYRKRQLEIFSRMLKETHFYKTYAMDESISDQSEEKVWQHFFSKNDWIFGYGLDYRFEGILQKEFYASNVQASGKEAVITDFLLGDSKFTTFVEIKKPSTPLFGKSKNRSNCWCLSHDLIDSVSQILEQKASGQMRFDAGNLFNAEGNKIEQNAYDAKVILVIGSWSELGKATNELESQTKQKTFELYRRDSRNVKMLTYDELYERAEFIVIHKSRISISESEPTALEPLAVDREGAISGSKPDESEWEIPF